MQHLSWTICCIIGQLLILPLLYAQEPSTAEDSTVQSVSTPLNNEQPSFQVKNLTDYEWLGPSSSKNGTEKKSYPTLNWSGFVQLDSGWILHDDNTTAAVGPLNAEVGLRRVRLRVGGEVRKNTSYVIDLDFAANGHPSFRDVAVIFSDAKVFQNIEVGYFKQPFGMDAESSGRELLFMERQLPFALTPFRQTGIRAFGTFGQHDGTYAVSAYRYPTDSFGVSSGDSGGWGLALRQTILLFEQEDTLVHLGGGYSFINPSDDEVRYNVEPSFFSTDPTDPSTSGVPVFADTGAIPTEHSQLFNIELAGQWGPFRAQSEYRWSRVNRIDDEGVLFSGGYVQAGVLLTGGRPIYNKKRAIFSGVTQTSEFANGGVGAVELTGGWSIIDLNSKDIRGGVMQTLTVGVNWYLNDHARVILNAIPVVLEDPVVGNAESMVLAGRLQLEF